MSENDSFPTAPGNLPLHCPSCAQQLVVQTLCCPECATRIEGSYRLPLEMLLSDEERHFIRLFVRSSGSLKRMASLLHLSYPTVRNRLDEMIRRLESLETSVTPTSDHANR